MGVGAAPPGARRHHHEETAMKVLLDTDIGSDIDDAIALAYLLSHPECELMGITTVSGEPEKRAEMASAICHNAGKANIPIHAGCPQAIQVDIRQKTAEQAAALGRRPRCRNFASYTAIPFLRDVIRSRPREVTLLAIGPLTNVALLFALDPEIPSLLGQLVLMCGRFMDRMQGEWNAINDPHATALVYGAGCQARPMRHVSYGLDVTTRCTLPADEVRERFTARVLEPVRDFAEVWFSRSDKVTFHDPLAAACLFKPELCTYRKGLIRVPQEGPTAGWTVLDPNASPAPHTVAVNVDPERFFEHFFSVVT